MPGKLSEMRRHPWSLVVVCAIAWVFTAALLVPWLIQAAYAGHLEILRSMLPGREGTPVASYLAAWSAIAKSASFVLATLLLVAALAKRLLTPPRSTPTSPAHTTLRLREILLLGLWFGLIIGIGEAYYLAGKLLVLRQIVPNFRSAGPNALWMMPLGDAIFFTGLALLLAPVLLALEKRARQPRAGALLIGALCLVGILSLLMLPDRIHLWAAALLATGFAIQIARSGALERRLRQHGLLRRVLQLGVVPLALYLGVAVVEQVGERRRNAQIGAAPPNAAPNVLLLVLDTQRAQSMSLYGYSRPTTPRFLKLASEAAVFDRAIAPAPWTLPSHATILTGRYNADLGISWFAGLSSGFVTLAEVLRDKGYRTGGFVANTEYCNDLFGLDQGFARYRDEATNPGAFLEDTWLGRNIVGWIRNRLGDHAGLARRRADRVSAEFFQWVDDIPDRRPFFAFLNFFDSHAPYRAPRPFDTAFAEPGSRYWLAGPRAKQYSPTAIQELQRSYEGGTAYVDHQVGLLVDSLRRRGLLDNTIVIIVGDHGESQGEHGWIGHGNSVFLPEIWVPLLIRFPARVPKGVRIRPPVSPRDIPATVLDLVGIRDAGALPGASLARHWTGGRPNGAATPDSVLTEFGRTLSLVAGRYHLITRPGTLALLFDIENDPAEEHELGSLKNAQLRALRSTLERMTAAPRRGMGERFKQDPGEGH